MEDGENVLAEEFLRQKFATVLMTTATEQWMKDASAQQGNHRFADKTLAHAGQGLRLVLQKENGAIATEAQDPARQLKYATAMTMIVTVK